MDTVLCCRPPIPIPVFRLTDFAAQYMTFTENVTYIQADDIYSLEVHLLFHLVPPYTHTQPPG